MAGFCEKKQALFHAIRKTSLFYIAAHVRDGKYVLFLPWLKKKIQVEACKKELFFVVPEFGTKGQRGRNSEYICTGYESFEGTHTTSQKENLHIYNPCWKLSVLAQRGEEMRPVWYSNLLLQIYLLYSISILFYELSNLWRSNTA